MKKLYKLIFIFSIIAQPLLSRASDLYLTPGQVHKIRYDNVETIRVRGRNIIGVETAHNTITVTALKTGEASITLGQKTYKIFIVNKSQSGFLSALENLLQQFLGLKAYNQDGQVVVSGTVYRLSDWQAIYNLANDFKIGYKLDANIDSDIHSSAKKWILSKVAKSGLTTPHIDLENGAKIFLAIDEQKHNEHWAQIFKPFGIHFVYENSQVAVSPLIRVNIVVAEINKKIQSQLGVEWPEVLSASLVPSLKGPSSLEVFLKAMEQNGMGQILASPNLLARSGSEADFLAGGEFAIKILTARTREVVWKRHGIYLKIKPLADRLGRLNIELTTEVSLIDAAQSVDGIPGLKTNKMNTHFDLTEARTIVLSGLIRNDWGKSSNGIMGISKIPVLGALFRSEDFHNNRSELVIFVTPEIVKDSMSENNDNTTNKNLMPTDWVNHE